MLKPIRMYLKAHAHALTFSLKDFVKKPMATLMTVMVIAIALSLPVTLGVVVKNAQTVANSWQHGVQISLFLEQSLDKTAEKRILDTVRARSDVMWANFISPEQGLTTLEETTGMTDLAQLLDKNPLPSVIEAHPKLESKPKIERTVSELKAINGVYLAKLDMQWLERLRSIIGFFEQFELALFVLFSLAVFLVVGNTIRLIIHHREKEVKVLSLIGATERFIQRPFLYSGALFGFFGALLAWLVVSLFINWMEHAVVAIASLYHTGFTLKALNDQAILSLLAAGTFLGYLGAKVSLHRKIRAFQPQ